MDADLIARLAALPQRKDQTWQGGPVRLPMWVSDGPGEPAYLPYAVAWASRDGGDLDHERLVPRADLGVDDVVRFLLRFAESRRPTPYRPLRIQTTDRAFADAARAGLRLAGVEVEVVERLVLIEPMAQALGKASGVGAFPPLTASKGVDVARVRAFAEAAAAFREGAPWTRLAEDDLLQVEAPETFPFRWWTMRGWYGETQGVETFASLESFEESEGRPGAADGEGASIVFFRPEAAPLGDYDLWTSEGLPNGDPLLVPTPVRFAEDGRAKRPSARELALFEGLLRALADVDAAEVAAGRFARTVRTFDGSVAFRFALPHVLRDRDVATDATRGGADVRGLVAAARDAFGYTKRRLAAAALAAGPDDVEALMLAGDVAKDLDVAREHYGRAVASARARSAVDASPAAGAALAAALHVFGRAELDAGRPKEAIAPLEESFKRSAGVATLRHFDLLEARLRAGRDADARELLNSVPREDWGSTADYAEALLRFRAEGDSDAAREAAGAAIDAAPEVVDHLVEGTDAPEPRDGDGADDVYYAWRAVADAFESTDGGIEWIDDVAAERAEEGEDDEDDDA